MPGWRSGVVVTHFAKRDAVLRDLEQEARAATGGLWSDPQAVPVWPKYVCEQARAIDRQGVSVS